MTINFQMVLCRQLNISEVGVLNLIRELNQQYLQAIDRSHHFLGEKGLP
jgi:hypothetical protein